MAVLRSSLRVCGALPLWLRHRTATAARGGLLVSHGHGDYNSVRCRFVASAWATNKLQLPSRAQGRAFCNYSFFTGHGAQGVPPGNGSTLGEGINFLKGAIGMMKQASLRQKGKEDMLTGIRFLEKLAGDELQYNNSANAHDLLSMVLLLLVNNHLENQDLEAVVESSLKAICKLLKNAPQPILPNLRRTIAADKKVKARLDKIIRDNKTGAVEAQQILDHLSKNE